jgi:hypothetical protein
MPKVVYYRDASDDRLWRTRIVADNNEVVHASHRGWPDIADARINTWMLGRIIEDHAGLGYFADIEDSSVHSYSVLRVHKSTDGWRWYIKLAHDLITVAHAHESFTQKHGCVQNLILIGEFLHGDYEVSVERGQP